MCTQKHSFPLVLNRPHFITMSASWASDCGFFWIFAQLYWESSSITLTWTYYEGWLLRCCIIFVLMPFAITFPHCWLQLLFWWMQLWGSLFFCHPQFTSEFTLLPIKRPEFFSEYACSDWSKSTDEAFLVSAAPLIPVHKVYCVLCLCHCRSLKTLWFPPQRKALDLVQEISMINRGFKKSYG